jgi:hypothetical protein
MGVSRDAIVEGSVYVNSVPITLLFSLYRVDMTFTNDLLLLTVKTTQFENKFNYQLLTVSSYFYLVLKLFIKFKPL